MKKVIVTTTINAPTEAIEKYDSMKDWQLVVVGDRATPKYKIRGIFIPWKEQQKHFRDLCDLIGPDSVARGRMIAFIMAHRMNAGVVASIDDDCIPYPNWGKDLFIGRKTEVDYLPDLLVFDPLWRWNKSIWHRGFPLELLGQRAYADEWLKRKTVIPYVQEDLWGGEADVDSLLRLSGKTLSLGLASMTRPICPKAFAPINTQNTFILGKVLKDFFANIPFIGRADDIWAGYFFQAVHPGRTVYWNQSTEHKQARSHQSIVKDFYSEFFMYERTYDFIRALHTDGVEAAGDRFLSLETRAAISIYRSYFK